MEAEPLIKEENSKSFFMEDATHVVITGPPASRTVIDNLKKLLTQRQHSRESDAENKEVVPSTGSDLESELSFYSMLTSSTSDSDLDFLRTSPENRKSKRRPKRNLSTSSSSSSSSLSPVRERRKRPKTSRRGLKPRFDSKTQMIILEDWNGSKVSKAVSPRQRHSPSGQLADTSGDALTNNIVNINIMMNPTVKFDSDPHNQNASSSNKDSSSDHEDDDLGAEKKNGVRGTTHRLRKTRRDRNRRRKHSYNDHGRCQVKYHELHVNSEVSSGIGNGNKNIPSPKNNAAEGQEDSPLESSSLSSVSPPAKESIGSGVVVVVEETGKEACRHEAEQK